MQDDDRVPQFVNLSVEKPGLHLQDLGYAATELPPKAIAGARVLHQLQKVETLNILGNYAHGIHNDIMEKRRFKNVGVIYINVVATVVFFLLAINQAIDFIKRRDTERLPFSK